MEWSKFEIHQVKTGILNLLWLEKNGGELKNAWTPSEQSLKPIQKPAKKSFSDSVGSRQADRFCFVDILLPRHSALSTVYTLSHTV